MNPGRRLSLTWINIDRAKQLAIIRLFGKIEFDPSYDYKTERRDRSGLKP